MRTSKEMHMTDHARDPDHQPEDDKDYLGAEGGVSQQGRAGGRLPRDIGTRDELKRANERPAGKTRVRKSDEADTEENG